MKCKFCERETTNPGALKAHENACQLNPYRRSPNRSEKAGAQKGNIPWNTGTKQGRHPKWDLLYPDSVVFCENSTYARHSIKARIKAKNLIAYKCACCGIGPEWQGKPMPLILDHINGINNDNRLENLRFVCSNCDSQLPTYKAKNKRKIESMVDKQP